MIKEDVPKESLIALIHAIDQNLEKTIEIYAVGGTAMTLLNLKASTKDIDFNLKDDYSKIIFKKALDKTRHGFHIDIYSNGCIFTQQLPLDYIKKAILINEEFKNIKLYSIHPIDIVVTKIGRFDQRDFEDITDCVKKFKLNKKEIKKRGKQIIYAGNEANYKYNLEYTIKTLF